MALASGRCTECGFDPPTVSPSDAAAAVRSFPRRWRALLVRPDDADPEIVHRTPGSGEPAALDHAAVAAEGMATAAGALGRVRAHEGAVVDLGPADRPVALRAGGHTLEEVLAALAGAADNLAAVVESVHGDEWARGGLLPDGEAINALDIARAGVHAGSHHLRAAERVLARVRLLPR